MMRRMLWHLRCWQRKSSRPMLAGSLLAALCGVAYVAEIAPLEERVALQRSGIEQLHIAQAALPETPAIQTPVEQLDSFYAFFDDDDIVPTVLERLFAAAARENLNLPQGDYRVAKESTGRLARYEITLPVKGLYPGLRHFIAQSLKETPALSLQGVSFARQAVGDIGVDAQVRLTLYVRRTEEP
ncbi:MAG: hypothetical protein FWD51_00295 [Betaproteobacteria bacterium]|nr:hypothetical protein [Betaproteobacteria bacterium]